MTVLLQKDDGLPRRGKSTGRGRGLEHAARRPVPEEPLRHRRPQARRIALLAASPARGARPADLVEAEPAAQAAFVLTWGLLNFFWLALLRRPLTAAALSLALIVILILLSQLKHSVLMMTATFVDVMIIDLDTFSFLLTIIPGLAWKVGLAVAAGDPAARAAVADRAVPGAAQPRGSPAAMLCLVALAALSFAVPTDREDEFPPHQYVSKFARSAAVAAVDSGDPGRAGSRRRRRSGRASPAADLRAVPASCRTSSWCSTRSSFDATMMPDVKVGADYHAAVSARSTARNALVRGRGRRRTELVHRVQRAHRIVGALLRALRRVGHPARRRPGQARPAHALRRCGYTTYSLYSWFGAFVGARGFQTRTGIEHFLDAKAVRRGPADTDGFYYDHAARVIARERGNGPVFVFVYLAANHFPWDYRYRPDLMPGWVDPGNPSRSMSICAARR